MRSWDISILTRRLEKSVFLVKTAKRNTKLLNHFQKRKIQYTLRWLQEAGGGQWKRTKFSLTSLNSVPQEFSVLKNVGAVLAAQVLQSRGRLPGSLPETWTTTWCWLQGGCYCWQLLFTLSWPAFQSPSFYRAYA